MTYQVTNRITREVRTFSNRSLARRCADRWDAAYGSYIATIKPVQA